MPLLGLLILLPLAGAVLCLALNAGVARKLAIGVAVLELALSLAAYAAFDPALAGFQLVEQYRWVPGINLQVLLGIDGISILFLPMTALLTLAVLSTAGDTWPEERQGAFAGLMLVLQAGTMGIFTALDTILFFLFWELTLPPLFFLIARFGAGPQRRAAALKYTIYMLVGGMPLLFAFAALAFNHATATGAGFPAGLSFSLPDLLRVPVPANLQAIVFVLMLLGFGIKAPLFPLHTWLPKAALEGPAAITAWLVGLKLGVYGLIRFMLPLVPDAVARYQNALGLLGALTLVYAALLALRQTNLRALIAYAGISHVGLVVMGLASLTEQGVQGALLQLFNFTLIAFALMLCAGSLQRRFGSTELLHLGGLATVMPRLATLFVLFALASLGAPLTSGFPAELLLLIGNFKVHAGLGLIALAGALIGATALLQYVRRTFWGPLAEGAQHFGDVEGREFLLLLLFAALVFVFGLMPGLALDPSLTAVRALVASP